VENTEYTTKENDKKNAPTVGRERSFRARWGETLTKKGMTAVANYFLDNYIKIGLNAIEAMFIIHLFSYKWTVDAPYPSLITIAKKMGKSIDSIRRIARGLEKKGYLIRQLRTGKTNLYNLNPLIKKLEEFQLYAKLNRESMQVEPKPSVPMQTKEEPLRINNNNSSFISIGEIMRDKFSKPL
jgi:hypothetical protein